MGTRGSETQGGYILMRPEKCWADQAPWGGQRAPGLTTVGYFCDLPDSTLPLPVWVPDLKTRAWLDDL